MKLRDLTLSNIKGFIQGYLGYWFDSSEYKYHQLIHRLNGVNPQCLINKACVHCGCDMPQKLYDNRECEEGCYTEAIDYKVWKSISADEEYQKQFYQIETNVMIKLSKNNIPYEIIYVRNKGINEGRIKLL